MHEQESIEQTKGDIECEKKLRALEVDYAGLQSELQGLQEALQKSEESFIEVGRGCWSVLVHSGQ